jgi:hypothetical protein
MGRPKGCGVSVGSELGVDGNGLAVTLPGECEADDGGEGRPLAIVAPDAPPFAAADAGIGIGWTTTCGKGGEATVALLGSGFDGPVAPGTGEKASAASHVFFRAWVGRVETGGAETEDEARERFVGEGVSEPVGAVTALKVGLTGEAAALDRAVLLVEDESSADGRRAAVDGKDHTAETVGWAGVGLVKTSGAWVLGGWVGGVTASTGGETAGWGVVEMPLDSRSGKKTLPALSEEPPPPPPPAVIAVVVWPLPPLACRAGGLGGFVLLKRKR